MYYRQPRYFGDFHCIGGTCTNSCCFGWRIDWTPEEADKLKNAPGCSSELKELCEKSFEYDESIEKYLIVLGENNRCPFLTEDNFCRIQRELGEEYLSNTCRVYPRNYISAEPVCYSFCRMSCPEIMKYILNDDRAMDLVNINLKGKQTVTATSSDSAMLKNHPELKERYEIFEFFYETVSDKKRSVEDSLILGALAAQSLTKLVENGEIDRIPEALKSLRSQMHNPAQLKSLENIKPNYNISLGILGQMMKLICKRTNNIDTTISLTDNSGRFNINLYTAGEKLLTEYLEQNPFVMRNIALNLLFELVVPFKDCDLTIFENYAIYAAAFALIKLNAISIAELKNRVDNELSGRFNMDKFIIKSVAMISRSLFQNPDTHKIIHTILCGNSMLSPAYLALLIK